MPPRSLQEDERSGEEIKKNIHHESRQDVENQDAANIPRRIPQGIVFSLNHGTVDEEVPIEDVEVEWCASPHFLRYDSLMELRKWLVWDWLDPETNEVRRALNHEEALMIQASGIKLIRLVETERIQERPY